MPRTLIGAKSKISTNTGGNIYFGASTSLGPIEGSILGLFKSLSTLSEDVSETKLLS